MNLQTLMPNVMQYTDKLQAAIAATLQMFLISGIFTLIFGFIFGILLIVTKNDGIAPNKGIYYIVTVVTNFFRAIPFVILLIFLIPFTRLLVGTSIGVTGAIVPLVFGATPFFTRQVESVLASVDPGKIEAARAMGCSVPDIIFRVYLAEAVPDLWRAITITSISIVGLTTMAGAVGAGGIGSFAINYGQNLHHQDVVNVCVVILLIFVTVLQTVGNLLARKTTNRKIFAKKETL